MNVTEVPFLLFHKYIAYTSKQHCYFLFEINKVYFYKYQIFTISEYHEAHFISLLKTRVDQYYFHQVGSKLFIDGVTTV